MNKFAFRYVKSEGQFQAEYRLAHWSGHRVVRHENGQPKIFSHPLDAAVCAANELVSALNGNAAFWQGKTGNEARLAAERLFSRDTRTIDDQGQNESATPRAPEEARSA